MPGFSARIAVAVCRARYLASAVTLARLSDFNCPSIADVNLVTVFKQVVEGVHLETPS